MLVYVVLLHSVDNEQAEVGQCGRGHQDAADVWSQHPAGRVSARARSAAHHQQWRTHRSRRCARLPQHQRSI